MQRIGRTLPTQIILNLNAAYLVTLCLKPKLFSLKFVNSAHFNCFLRGIVCTFGFEINYITNRKQSNEEGLTIYDDGYSIGWMQ